MLKAAFLVQIRTFLVDIEKRKLKFSKNNLAYDKSMSSVDLNNLSIVDLQKIKKGKKTKLKKEFNEYKQQHEKQKLVHEIMGIEKQKKRL